MISTNWAKCDQGALLAVANDNDVLRMVHVSTGGGEWSDGNNEWTIEVQHFSNHPLSEMRLMKISSTLEKPIENRDSSTAVIVVN